MLPTLVIPPVVAETKLCADVSEEIPTLTVNVLLSTFVNSINLPLIGSVERGYGWFVALLSLAQVNVIEPSANLTKSPVANP